MELIAAQTAVAVAASGGDGPTDALKVDSDSESPTSTINNVEVVVPIAVVAGLLFVAVSSVLYVRCGRGESKAVVGDAASPEGGAVTFFESPF